MHSWTTCTICSTVTSRQINRGGVNKFRQFSQSSPIFFNPPYQILRFLNKKSNQYSCTDLLANQISTKQYRTTTQHSNTVQKGRLWSHQTIPAAHTRARARTITNIIHKIIAGFFGGGLIYFGILSLVQHFLTPPRLIWREVTVYV